MPNQPNVMTKSQETAIAEIRKLLTANFDSWLLTFKITDERLHSKINHEWHGDVVDVVGLAAIANGRMIEITSIRGGQ